MRSLACGTVPGSAARPRRRLAAVLVPVALAWGCAATRGGAPAHIAVAAATHYQTISGWEATTQAGQEAAPLSLYRDRLVALAVDDLGINRLRLQVRSGAENPRDYWSELRAGRLKENWRCVRYATVNDNADPNVINWNGFHWGDFDESVEQVVLPMKQRLEARGERLFLNLNYVAFYQQCRNVPYIHTDPEEYAEFMLAASLHLRQKYGLVPDAWEVMLEPDKTPFWRGAQLGQAIVATARRLKAAGFTPRFIAPSTANMTHAPAYFDDLARVPGALPWLSEISYHRYGIGAPALRSIAQRGQRYHLQTAMLEHIGSGYEDLHRDLEVGHVSAWQQFVLAYPARQDNGGAYFLIRTRPGAPPAVEMASRTRFLRQYFHYIRAGAVRIGATSSDAAMDPLAFLNRDGRYVVVVKAEAAGSLAVSGLPAGRYSMSYTTEAGSSPETPITLAPGAPLQAAIPDRGVLTIAGGPARGPLSAGSGSR